MCLCCVNVCADVEPDNTHWRKCSEHSLFKLYCVDVSLVHPYDISLWMFRFWPSACVLKWSPIFNFDQDLVMLILIYVFCLQTVFGQKMQAIMRYHILTLFHTLHFLKCWPSHTYSKQFCDSQFLSMRLLKVQLITFVLFLFKYLRNK
jgi:hypothetical protein